MDNRFIYHYEDDAMELGSVFDQEQGIRISLNIYW